MKKSLIFFLFILILSCEKEEDIYNIDLPPTSVISSNSRWGVVKFPYIKVRKTPEDKDLISSAFRQGDIVKILKSTEFKDSTEAGDIYWYYTVLEDVEGWIIGSDLSIYDSKEQAESASKMFK